MLTEGTLQPPLAQPWVRAYLEPLLEVPVVGKLPSPRPTQFIVVERVGGGMPTVITDMAMLMVDVWADEHADCERLALNVREHLARAPGKRVGEHTCVSFHHLGGPVYLPDPDIGTPRYRITCELVFRKQPIKEANNG